MEVWQRSGPTWRGNGYLRAMALFQSLYWLGQTSRQHGGAVKGVSTVVSRMNGLHGSRTGIFLIPAAPCAAVKNLQMQLSGSLAS